jgi:hypothetical protein
MAGSPRPTFVADDESEPWREDEMEALQEWELIENRADAHLLDRHHPQALRLELSRAQAQDRYRVQ